MTVNMINLLQGDQARPPGPSLQLKVPNRLIVSPAVSNTLCICWDNSDKSAAIGAKYLAVTHPLHLSSESDWAANTAIIYCWWRWCLPVYNNYAKQFSSQCEALQTAGRQQYLLQWDRGQRTTLRPGQPGGKPIRGLTTTRTR